MKDIKEQATFTPGKWEIETYENNGRGGYFVRSGGTPIAKVSVIPGSELANARLIAAAPEMLEALKLALRAINDVLPKVRSSESVDGYRCVLSDLNQAIAKATGQEE
jgi:hypothetical protein